MSKYTPTTRREMVKNFLGKVAGTRGIDVYANQNGYRIYLVKDGNQYDTVLGILNQYNVVSIVVSLNEIEIEITLLLYVLDIYISPTSSTDKSKAMLELLWEAREAYRDMSRDRINTADMFIEYYSSWISGFDYLTAIRGRLSKSEIAAITSDPVNYAANGNLFQREYARSLV